MQNVSRPPFGTDYRWDDLRTFLALWRGGSLVDAAETLGVTPSTIGRRLDALEEALGVQLFERTSEGVVATLAAEQLLPYAEAVERANQDFALALSGLERAPEGVVRVTGPPGLVDHFLAPVVGALRAAHPGLRIVLDASTAYADLSRGEADIALRTKRPTHGDLIVQQLGPFRSCVVGAHGRFASAVRAIGIHTLGWIQWGDDLAHLPDARWIATHVAPENIVLRTSSFSAQLEAARAGVGVILVAEPYADLDGVCRVPVRPARGQRMAPFPESPIYLVGHRALRHVPRVAVTWEFLKARFAGAAVNSAP